MTPSALRDYADPATLRARAPAARDVAPGLPGWARGTPTRPVAGAGFEPAKAEPTDLQSVPFDRSGIPPSGGQCSDRTLVRGGSYGSFASRSVSSAASGSVPAPNRTTTCPRRSNELRVEGPPRYPRDRRARRQAARRCRARPWRTDSSTAAARAARHTTARPRIRSASRRSLRTRRAASVLREATRASSGCGFRSGGSARA